MKKFIQPASGVFLALTVPVFAVIGFHVLARQDIGGVMSPHHDVKAMNIEHASSGGCCCPYCTQIAQ